MVLHTEDVIAPGVPSPSLRVIGAGFGRTGTLSLREALVRLGFGPCDHMLENFEHPDRFALWQEAFRRKQAGEPIDWRPLLGGYRAIVDWPGTYFWRELIAAHPDSKVILTVRDPARGYQSSLSTIFRMRARADTSLRARAMMRVLGLMIPPMRQGFQIVDDVIWNGTFAGRFTNREHALLSSRSTTVKSRKQSRRSACSSSPSSRVGGHFASSLRPLFQTGNPSRTLTTPRRSRSASRSVSLGRSCG